MRYSLLIVWLIAFLCVDLPTQSQDKPVLIVGVEDQDYRPYYYIDSDGEWRGYSRELFDLFAADTGYNLSLRPLPRRRMSRELIEGSLDLVYPDNPEWYLEFKSLVPTVFYSDPAIYTYKGVMRPASSLTRQSDLTIGIPHGFSPESFEPYIKEKGMILVSSPVFRGMIAQVLRGTFDGAYGDTMLIERIARNMSDEAGITLVLDPRLPIRRDAYQLSSTRRADVIKAFNLWRTANKDRIRKLLEKHGLDNSRVDPFRSGQ